MFVFWFYPLEFSNSLSLFIFGSAGGDQRGASRELAYSTFLKQVRLLQLLPVSLFEVCFPILLFGILKFSFLVHISGLGEHSRGRNCKWKLEMKLNDSFIDEDEIKYQENQEKEIWNILPPSKEQAKNTDRLLVIIRHEMQNVWFWIRQPTWTWLLV